MKHPQPKWPAILPNNAIIIDNESTGLDPDQHSLYQIAWMLPNRRIAELTFRPRPGALVEKDALDVNGMSLGKMDQISMGYWQGIEAFFQEIEEYGGRRMIIAGLNPATVELKFLQRAWRDLGKPERFFPFSHRTIDLHTLAVVESVKRGNAIPSGGLQTNEIYDLLGTEREPSPHRAYNGVEHEWLAFIRLSHDWKISDSGSNPEPEYESTEKVQIG